MDIGKLTSCIGELAKNVYFCGANENGENATIYAKDEKTKVQLINLLHRNKNADPAFRSIKVETTRSLKLKKTRSLEEILGRVPHQIIYFDPTATIERATILLSIVKQARQLLGTALKGCYFNSGKRNLYFQLDANSSALDLSAVQKQLEPIIMHNTQRLSNPFYYAITISLQKPHGEVIAIDKASVVEDSLKGFMKGLMSKLKWPLLVASATSSLSVMPAKANDGPLPAVSNTNAWVGAAGSYLHNQRTSGAGVIIDGGVAAPLGHDFGVQVHTYDGVAGNAGLISVDGYVFWRNPLQGLLGPHVLYTKSNSFHHTLFGLHGEGYLNNLTLVLEGGGAIRSNNQNNTYYGEAIVHWYAQPDWRVYVGGITVGGNVTGEVGTEYQFGLSSLPGLSIFADVGAGAHNLNYGFLGLRYYFGDINEPIKSLVRRQREDMVLPTLDPIDPPARPSPRISHMF